MHLFAFDWTFYKTIIEENFSFSIFFWRLYRNMTPSITDHFLIFKLLLFRPGWYRAESGSVWNHSLNVKTTNFVGQMISNKTSHAIPKQKGRCVSRYIIEKLLHIWNRFILNQLASSTLTQTKPSSIFGIDINSILCQFFKKVAIPMAAFSKTWNVN